MFGNPGESARWPWRQTRWSEAKPEELALADDARSLTWRALDRRLNRFANALAGQSLGADRRVAVFAENGIGPVVAHLAAIHAGVSTVPVSFHLTADELAYILEDSAARVLFVGRETAVTGVRAAAQVGVPTVVGWDCPSVEGVTDLDAWLAVASDDEPPADRPPRPHLHYTSGTTGRPKGTDTPPAMFAGGATVEEHFERVRANPMLALGGPHLVVGPLYHTGPLQAVRSLAGGVALVVQGRFDPEATLRAIQEHRVTTTVMVPTHFQRLLSLPAAVRERYDVSSLAAVIHTGSACPVEVKRAMIDWWGPVLYEAYGATESGTTTAITSAEWLEHPGSVGRCVPPFEVVVVSDDGSICPPNTPGQLYFRDGTGRGITYHNDAVGSASAHREPGVFTLGEIGYVDDDGYVFITDRASDMVVSGGVNIYPAEAELALAEHDGVADVACIGVPDDDLGEQLLALVVPADHAHPPAEGELIEFCRARLAHYKAPRRVEIVDGLGRNAMGKLNKRSLRAPYWPSARTIAGG